MTVPSRSCSTCSGRLPNAWKVFAQECLTDHKVRAAILQRARKGDSAILTLDGRSLPTYQRAADLADEVFRRHPDHPGASHYLIHAVDDPAHAAGGLEAARALARYSPDAGHPQHMTSHIFLALGMWDELVTANENTMRVMGRQMAAHGHHPAACGHGQTWLAYGYLQQGRLDTARAMVHACAREAAADADVTSADDIDPDNSSIGSAAFMWARYVIDAEAWSGEAIAKLPVE